VGFWNLYVRVRRGNGEAIQILKDYPIRFTSYSDIANATHSNFTLEYYYVGELIKVHNTAKDKYGNTLTDFGVKMRSRINYRFELPGPEVTGTAMIEIWDDHA
jgi:hypothetical protein